MKRIVILLVLMLASPPIAWSYNTAESPLTDGSAYQLNGQEWRLGFFQLDYGITNWLEVGTIHVLWLLRVSNLTTKLRVYESGRHRVSTEIGYFQVSAQDFDATNPDIVFYVVPWTTSWSRRGDDHTVSLNLLLSQTGLRGESSDADDVDLGGALVATSGILRPVYEYRLSRVTALLIEGNISLFQLVQGDARTTFDIDERTTLDVYGNADAEFTGDFLANLSASFFWSWSSFNLKAGLGYGHLSLPLVNFFIPNRRMVIPSLNLYWRF
ncbi:MAG: hypothetical protein VX589_01095 [Myxococcota bacterium]|nr:hypothetical protein [Myxococcota bacterium]